MNMLAMMIWLAVLTMIVMAAIGVYRKPETWHVYAIFLLFPAEFMFLIYVGTRDNRHKCLRRFLPHVWQHPEIREARAKYRYFFVNEKEGGAIVFTNVKPLHLLCMYPRERTDVDWANYRDNPAMKALDWAVMSTFYLRFVWPFILSPMQLAFLGYRTAMKHGDFQPGQRVLCIGSGPLPYHCWWKKKLGENGEIVALDLDPYVNKTSLRVERTYEWLRGLFFRRRWVSTQVTGDAEELPFAEHSFDHVVAIRCYHVNVREALSVLKPGGKLLVDGFSPMAEFDEKTQQVEFTNSGWSTVTA
jgi:hypothetical protein